MISLAQLQEELAAYLLAAVRDDADPAVASVAPTSGRSPAEQLALYRTLVRSQHGDALRETYPACCELVGRPYFQQLSSLYFASHPISQPDLGEYGQHLPQFLEEVVAERPEAAALHYLPDLARLEWAWDRANHQQAATTLHLAEPVHLLWDAILEERDPPAFLGDGAVVVEIWRQDDQRKIRVVPQP